MSYTPTSYYGHTVKDRTAEFHSCLDALQSRNGSGSASASASALPSSSAKQRLLNPQQQQQAAAGATTSSSSSASSSTSHRGEFARRAHAISNDIASTTNKLQRLAQLARRKTLFDDRPVEISELTYIIKHDIAAINKQLADLQAYNKANKRTTPDRAEEHRGNVVTLLQSKLAGATTSFQDILEVRTQNIKASKDRSEQFMYGGAGGGGAAATNAGPTPFGMGENSDSPLYNPTRTNSAMAHRAAPQQAGQQAGMAGQAQGYDSYDPKGKGKGVDGGDFLALDMGAGGGAGGAGTAGGGDQFMQMQLMENRQDTYLQTRSTAIESIESTISELGQIFSQLAHMVAEQRETVQRIDDNVMEVVDNVGGAQRELLKYYASVSSNRWLMLKIFGVLIVFFLIFILVS